MKKFLSIISMACLMLVSFSSCKEDTEPRIGIPHEFVLNTPPMANQTYILSATSSIDLSWSQPDYGLGLVPTYTVEIAKPADAYYDSDFIALDGNYTQAAVSVPGEAFAMGVCELFGYDDPSNFDASPRPIAVRVKSDIANIVTNPGSAMIYSNPIVLKSVVPYFAVKLPAKLYVVGDVQGWDINNGSFVISEPENGIGSKIYSGTIEMTAEQAANGFRLYQSLGSWGNDGEAPSLGAAANDGDNQAVTVNDAGNYTGSCVWGKGNWNITNWPGGKMQITVDLNNMSIAFDHVD
ncbi:MAG: SusE domain-containing protein [Pseudoflavonifractor sp.]|nr:SusE domain-containing protein [Alloprevotella sp.]MCM1117121.1 SusE domain-containing protein [Pseudoflavonifractor sp.]